MLHGGVAPTNGEYLEALADLPDAIEQRAVGFDLDLRAAELRRVPAFDRTAKLHRRRLLAVADRQDRQAAREYALLEYLALHHGKLVTRTELYEHLFDENDTSLSNLLEVHVSNVRKKLGHDFITTRRGHGYSILAPP